MLKNYLKNKYIRNSLIILVVTITLLATDLILKHFLYDAKFEQDHIPYGIGINSARQWDIKALAGRSLLHESSTFLDFIGGKLPRWSGLLINYSIAALFIAIGFLSKSKGVVIGAAITLAGILGNTMDSTFFSTVINGVVHYGVRDIFFLPYWDRGTFNLADCIVVVGAVTTAISFLVSAFKKD